MALMQPSSQTGKQDLITKQHAAVALPFLLSKFVCVVITPPERYHVALCRHRGTSPQTWVQELQILSSSQYSIYEDWLIYSFKNKIIWCIPERSQSSSVCLSGTVVALGSYNLRNTHFLAKLANLTHHFSSFPLLASCSSFLKWIPVTLVLLILILEAKETLPVQSCPMTVPPQILNPLI